MTGAEVQDYVWWVWAGRTLHGRDFEPGDAGRLLDSLSDVGLD